MTKKRAQKQTSPSPKPRASRVGSSNSSAVRLAKHIARSIFASSGDSRGPCTRIQFMLGKWPDEKAGGGLCERALQTVIADALRSLPNKQVSNDPPSAGRAL